MASPVRIAFAGSTDVTGSVSIDVQTPPTTFGVLTIAAECPGSPNWRVSSAGLPLAFGNGGQVSLGPILTSPGERLTITVTGANPGVTAKGSLSGNQYPSAEEAAANYKPTANAVTISTQQGQFVIGTITTGGAGVPLTQTFPMPAGALGIQFICSSAAGFALPNEVKVVGDVTNDAYLDDLQSLGPFGADMARWIPPDQNAICTVTDNGATPARVTFVALPFVPTVNIRTPQTTPILVQESSTPRPWQAPNQPPALINVLIVAGGNSVIIAAAVGVTIRLFDVNLGCDNPVAASAFTLQDTAGTTLHTFEQVAVPNPFRGAGVALTTGVGLRVGNPTAAGITVRGSALYST